jgi:hypothetical protein
LHLQSNFFEAYNVRIAGQTSLADSTKTAVEVVGRAYYMTVNARTEIQSLLVSGGKVGFLTAEQAKASAPGDGYEHAWIFWKFQLRERGMIAHQPFLG